MKKLMMAVAVAAMGMGVFAQEAAPAPAPQGAVPPPPAAEAAKAAPVRPKFDRAKYEERMRQRRAERRQKMVDIILKHGVDPAKANAIVDDLEKMNMRPPRPARKAPGAAGAGAAVPPPPPAAAAAEASGAVPPPPPAK